MSVMSSGRVRHKAPGPVGDGPEAAQISALLAWRGAARSARTVLLEASRVAITGSPNGVQRSRAAIKGLRQLEADIDRLLAAPG